MPCAVTCARVAIASGLVALFCYFMSAVVRPFPAPVGRVLFFTVGPLTIISVVAFYRVIRIAGETLSLQLGVVFHIIGGAVMNMMAVVQATQFTTMARKINAASGEAAKETLTEILWGVNVVQAGLDVSWDVFVSLGTVLLGVALLRHPRYGRTFGAVGIVVASAALVFNLATFPTAPAEAGLIDLGPVVGLWYAAVLVQLWRSMGWVRDLGQEP